MSRTLGLQAGISPRQANWISPDPTAANGPHQVFVATASGSVTGVILGNEDDTLGNRIILFRDDGSASPIDDPNLRLIFDIPPLFGHGFFNFFGCEFGFNKGDILTIQRTAGGVATWTYNVSYFLNQ